MPPSLQINGLIPATFTPLKETGELNLGQIPKVVETMIQRGAAGIYVLGSTGEGVSLTYEERLAAAKAFVDSASKAIPVIVQVGCESVYQARELAAHAAEIGADAISAVCPFYFRPETMSSLIDSMELIASGARELPFFYYHIPAFTGVSFSMETFINTASDRIPNLAGLKFTSNNLHEYQACVELATDRKQQVFWGVDEMLLSALTSGAHAAVGSTYNFALPVSAKIIESFQSGNLQEAKLWQSRSQLLVRTLLPFGIKAAQKAVMRTLGVDCGPCRLPTISLDANAQNKLETQLTEIGFYEWIS